MTNSMKALHIEAAVVITETEGRDIKFLKALGKFVTLSVQTSIGTMKGLAEISFLNQDPEWLNGNADRDFWVASLCKYTFKVGKNSSPISHSFELLFSEGQRGYFIDGFQIRHDGKVYFRKIDQNIANGKDLLRKIDQFYKELYMQGSLISAHLMNNLVGSQMTQFTRSDISELQRKLDRNSHRLPPNEIVYSFGCLYVVIYYKDSDGLIFSALERELNSLGFKLKRADKQVRTSNIYLDCAFELIPAPSTQSIRASDIAKAITKTSDQ